MFIKVMTSRIIIFVLLIALVQNTFSCCLVYNQGVKLCLSLIEEENSEQENSNKNQEKISEFLVDNVLEASLSINDYRLFSKNNIYFNLHYKNSGIKPVYDTPPEAFI